MGDMDFADSLRLAIAIGMTVFMVILRFDQERIMRSDYFRSRSRWMGPLSYYGLVLLFTAGIILILPRGRAALFLVGGDPADLLPAMLAFGVIGALNGAALALVRFRALLPLPLEMLPSRTVAAGLNAVAEELQFRSVILGLMLVGGLDPALAILLQADPLRRRPPARLARPRLVLRDRLGDPGLRLRPGHGQHRIGHPGHGRPLRRHDGHLCLRRRPPEDAAHLAPPRGPRWFPHAARRPTLEAA